MTSPSRRKRRTTAHAPTCPTRTPAERRPLGAAPLAVLALLALAALAPAQQGPALGTPQNTQRADVIATPANWSVPRPPTVRLPSPVVPVRYQQPAGRGGRPYTASGDDEGLDYQIQ